MIVQVRVKSALGKGRHPHKPIHSWPWSQSYSEPKFSSNVSLSCDRARKNLQSLRVLKRNEMTSQKLCNCRVKAQSTDRFTPAILELSILPPTPSCTSKGSNSVAARGLSIYVGYDTPFIQVVEASLSTLNGHIINCANL